MSSIHSVLESEELAHVWSQYIRAHCDVDLIRIELLAIGFLLEA